MSGNDERAEKKIVAMCLLIYTAIYLGRKNFAVCLPEMISAGVLDKVAGGFIGTGFLVFYAAGQLVNGILGDKLSPKYMLATGLAGAGCANIAMGLSSAYPAFLAIWCLCGWFCSMLWSPIVRAVSSWTNERVAASAGASLSVTIPAGTVASYLLCSAALRWSTWRAAFIIPGAMLVAVAVIIFIVMHSLSDHIKAREAESAARLDDSSGDVAQGRLGTAELLKLCAACGIGFACVSITMNGAFKDGLDMWIPTFLSENRVGDAATASLICSLLPVAGVFGPFVTKWLDRKFFRNELASTGAMFGVSLLCLLAVYALSKSESVAATVFIVLFLAISSAAMLGANTMLLTYIPFRFAKYGRASTVSGALDAFSYGAASVTGALTGAVSKSGGWGAAFILFAAFAVVGAALSYAGAGRLSRMK